jgi:hypothetical protein
VNQTCDTLKLQLLAANEKIECQAMALRAQSYQRQSEDEADFGAISARLDISNGKLSCTQICARKYKVERDIAIVNLTRMSRQNATLTVSIETINNMLRTIPTPSAAQVNALSASAMVTSASVVMEAVEGPKEGPEEGPEDIGYAYADEEATEELETVVPNTAVFVPYVVVGPAQTADPKATEDELLDYSSTDEEFQDVPEDQMECEYTDLPTCFLLELNVRPCR